MCLQSMAENKLTSLEQALGYEFQKKELMIEALTHRSHHHETGDSPQNERLEFLGDAVLDLCITEIVMELSPTTDEGTLSKLRSQLVSQSALHEVALQLNIGPHLRLGKGEELTGGRSRPSLLADAVEALLAAVYLDGGLEIVRSRIRQLWGFALTTQEAAWTSTTRHILTLDHKSRLQEVCQSQSFGTPSYVCQSSQGPDHKKLFTMALVLQGKVLCTALGATKKEASLLAAKSVWDLAEGDSKALVQWLKAQGMMSRHRRSKVEEISR